MSWNKRVVGVEALIAATTACSVLRTLLLHHAVAVCLVLCSCTQQSWLHAAVLYCSVAPL
jgi:hypothetical protein